MMIRTGVGRPVGAVVGAVVGSLVGAAVGAHERNAFDLCDCVVYRV